MAYNNPFVRGSPSGSNSPAPSIASTSSDHESYLLIDSDESMTTPRQFLGHPHFSNRPSSVFTDMEIDPPSQVIDLTADDDPPAAQHPAIQVNGGSHNRGTMNRPGGDSKVATIARSDTERVAPGSSRSAGKRKAQARPVDQHREPSPRGSRTWIDAQTVRRIDNLCSRMSQMEQDKKNHDNRFQTLDADHQQLSARMDTAEESIKTIDRSVYQLSTRMSKVEKSFKGIQKGISGLSAKIHQDEEQRKEDAQRRERQREIAEQNHEFRHRMLIALLRPDIFGLGPGLSPGLGPGLDPGLMSQNIPESTGYSSPHSWHSEIAPSEISHHTYSSHNSTLYEDRTPRRSGYEDPRRSKGSRGKRGYKPRPGKTRRQSAPSTRICTPVPDSTPTRRNNWIDSPSAASGAGVAESVHSIKSEHSPNSEYFPDTTPQHSPSPKREASSSCPPGSSPYFRPESRSSQTN